MTREELLDLRSLGVELSAEVECFCVGSESWDHVPIVVKGLLYGDFFPLSGLYSKVRHIHLRKNSTHAG